jgi:tRNA A-37 threonylcarbamoyl transferase component Bud32
MTPDIHLYPHWNVGFDLFQLFKSSVLSLQQLLEHEKYSPNGITLNMLYTHRFPNILSDTINDGLKLIHASIDILSMNSCTHSSFHSANFPITFQHNTFDMDDNCLQGYTFTKGIASGNYGTVIAVTKNGFDYAIKVEELYNNDQLKESNILMFLSNYDICPKYYGNFIITQGNIQYFCTVMDLMDTDLFTYMDNPVNIQYKQKLFSDIHTRIQHMHTLGFIHCDLKLENCAVKVIDDIPTAYLIDFGKSCLNPNVPESTIQELHTLHLSYDLMQYNTVAEFFIQKIMFPYIPDYIQKIFPSLFHEIKECFEPEYQEKNIELLKTNPEMIDFWFAYCLLRNLKKSPSVVINDLSVYFPIPYGIK